MMNIVKIFKAYFKRREPTREEVADLIERFLEDRTTDWEWDDFISLRITDPYLDQIRIQISGLEEYRSEFSERTLKAFVRDLRGGLTRRSS